MRKLILIILAVCLQPLFGQISTTRMGDLYIYSSIAQVENVVGHPLEFHEEEDWIKIGKVIHKGIEYELTFSEVYNPAAEKESFGLSGISTTSKNIKTLSKMGIGNTYEELLNTYKNYRSFSVYEIEDEYEDGKLAPIKFFVLDDEENYTYIRFFLRNNVVYRIAVFVNQGC